MTLHNFLEMLKKALDLYCDQPAFGGESGAYYKYCDMIAKKFQETC